MRKINRKDLKEGPNEKRNEKGLEDMENMVDKVVMYEEYGEHLLKKKCVLVLSPFFLHQKGNRSRRKRKKKHKHALKRKTKRTKIMSKIFGT